VDDSARAVADFIQLTPWVDCWGRGISSVEGERHRLACEERLACRAIGALARREAPCRAGSTPVSTAASWPWSLLPWSSTARIFASRERPLPSWKRQTLKLPAAATADSPLLLWAWNALAPETSVPRGESGEASPSLLLWQGSGSQAGEAVRGAESRP